MNKIKNMVLRSVTRTSAAVSLAVIAVGACGVTAASAASSEPGGDHGTGLPPRTLFGWELVTLPNANVANFQRRTLYCPAGKRVLGGGAEARGERAILVGSFPTSDGRGWIGIGRQDGYPSVGISVFAICAPVGGTR